MILTVKLIFFKLILLYKTFKKLYIYFTMLFSKLAGS